MIDRTAFAGGPFVERFEKEFAEFCNCDFAVGVGSGTSALWTALVGLGVGPGDEVITVSNTFIATAEAITWSGASPVFVDVDERTYTLDPACVERALTPRTKAIIPVHLYGQMADMDPILKIARDRDLFVIEDAAQAHGAEYWGKRAGSLGDAGCFSFYPGKNLGAYGEAGAVVTRHGWLADRIRKFRDHGQARKYVHEMVGWNDRMDGIQAAVLSVKLKHLKAWNSARRRAAAWYRDLLSGIDGLVLPYEAPYSTHIYHLYSIQADQREELGKSLQEAGIGWGMHYPIPVHLQEAYGHLGMARGCLPVTEAFTARQLSLPMYPELEQEAVERTAEVVKRHLLVTAS